MVKICFDRFKIAGFCFILLYLAISINNQLNFTFKPFFSSYKNILYMLPKDDLAQLKELAPPFYDVIRTINTYPETTNFYYTQYFGNSENARIEWWYLYALVRYLCYPRKILCMHPIVYNEKEEEFIHKFIGAAERYSELEWIKARNVSYVISLRNYNISILPIENKIYDILR